MVPPPSAPNPMPARYQLLERPSVGPQRIRTCDATAVGGANRSRGGVWADHHGIVAAVSFAVVRAPGREHQPLNTRTIGRSGETACLPWSCEPRVAGGGRPYRFRNLQ